MIISFTAQPQGGYLGQDHTLSMFLTKISVSTLPFGLNKGLANNHLSANVVLWFDCTICGTTGIERIFHLLCDTKKRKCCIFGEKRNQCLSVFYNNFYVK